MNIKNGQSNCTSTLRTFTCFVYLGRIKGQLVATQSSQHHLKECAKCGEANLALDGNTDGEYYSGSCTSTDKNDNDNWWKVDFQSIFVVTGVILWNRSWGLCTCLHYCTLKLVSINALGTFHLFIVFFRVSLRQY